MFRLVLLIVLKIFRNQTFVEKSCLVNNKFYICNKMLYCSEYSISLNSDFRRQNKHVRILWGY